MTEENKFSYQNCPYCRNKVESLQEHYPRCLMRDILITGDREIEDKLRDLINKERQAKA